MYAKEEAGREGGWGWGNAIVLHIRQYGPVAENAAGVLGKTKDGFIVVSPAVAEELRKVKTQLLEEISTKLCETKSYDDVQEELHQVKAAHSDIMS